MASTNGGHITKAEKHALNQQENQVSKQIGKKPQLVLGKKERMAPRPLGLARAQGGSGCRNRRDIQPARRCAPSQAFRENGVKLVSRS
jgi:hypothetical protein